MTQASDIANPPLARKELATLPHGSSVYRSLIREDAERLGRPDVDLRQVEACMRRERGTLDQLSRTEFLNEVIAAIHCLDTTGPEAANRLAALFSLPS
jgi:hypothetical protein